MIFFLCKNILIIVLQTYRGFVIFNDRYINPKPPSPAELALMKQRQNRRASHTSNNESPNPRSDKRRGTLAERRPTGVTKVPRRSMQSGLSDEGRQQAPNLLDWFDLGEHAPQPEASQVSRRASNVPHHSSASRQVVKATKITSPVIEKCSPLPAPPQKQEREERPRSSFDDYIDWMFLSRVYRKVP